MSDEPARKRARTKKAPKTAAAKAGSQTNGSSAAPSTAGRAQSSGHRGSGRGTSAAGARPADAAVSAAQSGPAAIASTATAASVATEQPAPVPAAAPPPSSPLPPAPAPASATAPASAPASAPAAASAAASSPAAVETKCQAFLRLSSECRPSTTVSPLIYLTRDVVTIGRLPTNDVAMDSKRTPQMISRQHARLLTKTVGKQQEWIVQDCKSLNGVTVNGESVDSASAGRTLRSGDIINFGRRVNPPEFEFIFEVSHPCADASSSSAAHPPSSGQHPDEVFGEQASRTALNVSELSSELACCICKDWLIHAATIDCSHTFCWDCIDRWLQTKQFVCPVCREEVTREPVRTRAVDGIVLKTVQRLPEKEQADHEERVSTAEAAGARKRASLLELEKSVDDAIKKGKNFFNIDMNWGRRDKDVFAKGVKEYSGAARETYCRLTGLTLRWVHSAGPDKLNQALHNLGLGNQASRPDEEIRRRLLMFLRYG